MNIRYISHAEIIQRQHQVRRDIQYGRNHAVIGNLRTRIGIAIIAFGNRVHGTAAPVEHPRRIANQTPALERGI